MQSSVQQAIASNAMPVLGVQYWLASIFYFLCVLAILWLWSTITRRMPKPLGGILWIFMLALLCTPVIVEGPNPQLAPALIGFVFAILSKDSAHIMAGLFPIMIMTGIGCLFGFMYAFIKEKIE